MILSYKERKEAVIEDFEEFHESLGYPINQAFYATLGESEYSKDYTQTDECCIYLNFALMLLERKENIEFMKNRLLELIADENIEIYKEELSEEFNEFIKDLKTFEDFMKQ